MKARAIFLLNGKVALVGDDLLKVFSSVSQAVTYCNEQNIDAEII